MGTVSGWGRVNNPAAMRDARRKDSSLAATTPNAGSGAGLFVLTPSQAIPVIEVCLYRLPRQFKSFLSLVAYQRGAASRFSAATVNGDENAGAHEQDGEDG